MAIMTSTNTRPTSETRRKVAQVAYHTPLGDNGKTVEFTDAGLLLAASVLQSAIDKGASLSTQNAQIALHHAYRRGIDNVDFVILGSEHETDNPYFGMYS